MGIRVLIADDQTLVRAGFRMILETDEDVCVVAEADDGAEAVEATRRTRPDVVLMDIRMPVMDGLEATRRIAASENPPRVLMLTTFDRRPPTSDLNAGIRQRWACEFAQEHAPRATPGDDRIAMDWSALRRLGRTHAFRVLPERRARPRGGRPDFSLLLLRAGPAPLLHCGWLRAPGHPAANGSSSAEGRAMGTGAD